MTTQPQRPTGFLEGQVSQFDLLLAAIPFILGVGILTAPLLPVPQYVGIALSAAIAGCLVGYSIYAITRVDPTVADEQPPRSRLAD